MHARTRACNVQARTLLSVWPWPMQKASVAHARTVHWPQLPRHILCAAAAPHPSLQSSVGLQLEQLAVNCNAAEKAHPDASYIELLRLFKVRSRRWALVVRILHRACRALPAHICSQLPRLTLCSVLRWLLACLLVCLFVCLFACLLATGLCKTHRRWRGLRRTRVVAW
jgi:hypothetical protein